jgi:hypothetical protein
MRKLAVAIGIAGLLCAGHAKAQSVACGVVDQLAPEWMPGAIGFHIAGSGSCGGMIWYYGSQAGGAPSVPYVLSELMMSINTGAIIGVWTNSCDAQYVELGKC